MVRGWVALVMLLTVWLVPGAMTSGAAGDAEVAKLRSELEQLRGRLPSQSHAMMDVGYHFANLWFAGQSKNWPLAQFYLDETRSHLRWAVRIVPVRRTSAGELDLRGLLEAVDQAGMEEIDKAIVGRDSDAFTAAYRQALVGCYTCHKAADKPYLRPRIPEQPEARIINFDPAATWP
jgi:hypothetical protein